jgi:hypothetical protein
MLVRSRAMPGAVTVLCFGPVISSVCGPAKCYVDRVPMTGVSARKERRRRRNAKVVTEVTPQSEAGTHGSVPFGADESVRRHFGDVTRMDPVDSSRGAKWRGERI